MNFMFFHRMILKIIVEMIHNSEKPLKVCVFAFPEYDEFLNL